MAIFSSDKRRTASVKAIEDSTAIVLLSFSITDLSNKHPEIMEKIKKVIKQRKLQNENSETLRKN
jgi:CRP-like cAMP-binding protein